MEHKQFCVLYDIGHTVDSIEFDTHEEALGCMKDLYLGWIEDERAEWDGEPTPEQVESWNEMVDACYCLILRWNDFLGEYEDTYWGEPLPDEDLEAIGWIEL